MVRQHRHSNTRVTRVPSGNSRDWCVPGRGRGLTYGSRTAHDSYAATAEAPGTKEQPFDGWGALGVLLAAGVFLWCSRRKRVAATESGADL